jgi:hypothetical protein
MMARLFQDTRPEAEQMFVDLLRQAPPWRKLQMVGQMWKTVRQLTFVGLRERHPTATKLELRCYLASALLGDMLAEKVIRLLKEGDGEMPDEPISVTFLVTDILENLNIPYFVGGSLASAIHGVSRATMDADIIAEMQPEQAEPFALALGEAFYVDVLAVYDAIERHDSFNVIHLATMFKVDIFIPKMRPFERTQFMRREQKTLSPDEMRTTYVASAEDIILAKLEWYQVGGGASKRQWEDVRGVLRMQADRLDIDYLQHWADELEVSELLANLLDEIESS